MQQENKPIGYWIKQADELLTQGINTIQASFQLDRTDWQVLNTIAEHRSIGSRELTQSIQPFAN